MKETPAFTVPLLTHPADIQTAPKLPIDCYGWNSRIQPKAFAQIGYDRFSSSEKLVLLLTCLESHPLCSMQEHNQPVYKDSALEFFIRPKGCAGYFNFECNSAGAMLAMYGGGRTNRSFFPREDILRLRIQAHKTDKMWNVLFEVPYDLLASYEPFEPWFREPSFSCNFYKISETKAIEHYGSYAPIASPEPNFHRPEDFAKAQIAAGLS